VVKGKLCERKVKAELEIKEEGGRLIVEVWKKKCFCWIWKMFYWIKAKKIVPCGEVGLVVSNHKKNFQSFLDSYPFPGSFHDASSW